MPFTISIGVTAGKATLLRMPDLAEGSNGIAALAVTFDESWDAFPTRTAILWYEGETVLRVPLDADGKAMVPSVFTQSDRPFLLRVAGENGAQCIQTNELCTQFDKLHAADAQDRQFTVYTGAYRLTENKTYPTKDALLTQDVTVDVATTDTSHDTVTPQTLLPGVTAHDASGAQITGAYANPYNANTSHDTVTPQTLLPGVTAHDASGAQITGTYVNPYNANTSHDTVTPQTLLPGVTAHDASGAQITGTYANPYNADTTKDTVTELTLLDGATAHDANGNAIVGAVDTAKIRTEGYNEGYSAGYNAGMDEGYALGYDKGYAAGYEACFAAGKASSDGNTTVDDETGTTNIMLSRVTIEGGTTIEEA